MLFGKFRILGKLALLVLIPLLGVVALSVPVVANRIAAANDAQDISDTVALASRVGTAVQRLQEERLLSVGFLFGLVDQAQLVVQSADANDAVARITAGGEKVPAALRQAVDDMSRLNSTRRNVLKRTARPDVIVTEFTNVTTPIINGLALSAVADLRTSVGRQLYALEQALRSDDLMSQASGHLTSAVFTKNSGLVGLFFSTLIQLQQIIVNSQQFFTDEQYKLYTSVQESLSTRIGPQFLLQAPVNPNAAVQLLNIKTLFPSLQSVLILGGFVERRIAADVTTIATKNRNAALRDAFLVGGGSLLLLLLVIALSVVMAGAVARPLRRLTVSADRIARAAESELERVADDDADTVRPIRLDPVDVEAQDEIGDLARAFDRVQTTAVRLVERQVLSRRNVAQMFAHVGRRTQNLVGRQLALIDQLERRETDSDRLGELYRLDHMSSRLRRNASSLVVLSGGAGANEHMAPLPLSDVVRLALAEIEDYTRVDVDVPEDIVMVPAVLADLNLLLAELMENATSFSPPHTRVVVRATDLHGGVRLAIVDQGLGMPPERLAEENARLTRRERLDLAPSEVLGLFVVGRLARRHGIEVTLSETPGGGVTASVDLAPAHLIARATATATPVSPFAAPVASVHHTAEFAQVLAGSAARASVPGSQQPFDPNVVERAARTLEAGQTWNAFVPTRTATGPVIEATPAPGRIAGPVYDAEPVYSPGLAYQQPAGAPSATVYQSAYRKPVSAPPVSVPPASVPSASVSQAAHQEALSVQPAYDPGAPVAGRLPAAMPELPAAGPGAWSGPVSPAPQPTWSTPAETSATWSTPAEASIPRQRTGEDFRLDTPAGPARPAAPGGGLRRRVPGDQLPEETGTRLAATPPSPADAQAARAALDAFEDGVSRAEWEAVETGMFAPPAVGHPPLTRRVPGATLPVGAPDSPPTPVATSPQDPEAARALMEQFEYGVALALNEVQPQPEGQSR